jgi:hypothetical protein
MPIIEDEVWHEYCENSKLYPSIFTKKSGYLLATILSNLDAYLTVPIPYRSKPFDPNYNEWRIVKWPAGKTLDEFIDILDSSHIDDRGIHEKYYDKAILRYQIRSYFWAENSNTNGPPFENYVCTCNSRKYPAIPYSFLLIGDDKIRSKAINLLYDMKESEKNKNE